MRILVTSDLHLDITGPEPIRRMVAGMDREHPDLVVLAGDLATPSRLFEQCLSFFLQLSCPVAVLPGNRDLYAAATETSALLLEEILPETVRSMGLHWLPDEPLTFPDGTAVCGSLGWYDYGACDPALGLGDDEILREKPSYCRDAARINWEWSDRELAERLRRRLQHQMLSLEENEAVRRVLAVTHVPVFDAQLERNPDDDRWSVASAFYGHMALGESLRGFPKLRYVVSGHTHIGLHGVVERSGAPPIGAAVVGSDYGLPRWVNVELD